MVLAGIKINNKLRIQRKSTDNDAINEHQATNSNWQKGKLPRLTGCPSSNILRKWLDSWIVAVCKKQQKKQCDHSKQTRYYFSHTLEIVLYYKRWTMNKHGSECGRPRSPQWRSDAILFWPQPTIGEQFKIPNHLFSHIHIHNTRWEITMMFYKT